MGKLHYSPRAQDPPQAMLPGSCVQGSVIYDTSMSIDAIGMDGMVIVELKKELSLQIIRIVVKQDFQNYCNYYQSN